MNPIRAALRRSFAARTRAALAAADRIALTPPPGLESLEGRVLLSSVTLTNTTDTWIPDVSSTLSRVVGGDLPNDAVITSVDVSFRANHGRGSDLELVLSHGGPPSVFAPSTMVWDHGDGANPRAELTGITAFNGWRADAGWAVTARDTVAGITGYLDEWSITVHYETSLPVPTTSAPGSPSNEPLIAPPVRNRGMVFRFDPVTGATGYKIYLSNHNRVPLGELTVPSGIVSGYQAPMDFVIPTGLTRWSIATIKDGVVGLRGNERIFMAEELPPPILQLPGKTTPSTPEAINTRRPTFYFQSVPGATHYRLTLTDVLGGGSETYFITPTDQIYPSWQLPSELPNDRTYSWSMVTAIGGSLSAASSPLYFRTPPATAPNAPVTTNPGSTNPQSPSSLTSTSTWFSWQAVSGATQLKIYIRNPATDQISNYTIAGGATTYGINLSSLANNTMYEWWMTSLSGTTESAPGAKRYFRTPGAWVSSFPLGPGTTTGPGPVLTPSEVLFRWDANAVPNTPSRIYVRNLDTDQLHVLNTAAGVTSFTPPAGTLAAGHRFSWYMVGIGANGNEGFATPIRYFQTAPATIVPAKLTGAIIGTTGSYKNSGNTREKAFDGNLATYFDGPTSSGVWAGLDLGSGKTVTKARFAPRSGSAARMVGGKFQVSSNGTTWTDLATINTTPGSGWNELSFTNTNAYRYVRYLGPSGSSGNVAELEFWGMGDGTTAPADLRPADIVATPNTATPGGNFNLKFNVRNGGGVASGPTSAIVELVQYTGGSTPSFVLTLHGDVSIPAIAAGGTHAVDLNFTLPTNVVPGSYQIAVRVDPNNVAGQVDLKNDVLNIGFTVAPVPTGPAADLTPENVSNDAITIYPYDRFNFYFGVRNLGTGPSKATTGRISVRNAAGQQVSYYGPNFAIPAIPAGGYIALPQSLTSPSVQPGTYYLVVQVDVAGTADQAPGKTGNDLVVSSTPITVAADPDDPSTPAKLTGAIIGTAGSYKNNGNTREKVFDGNLATYFDGPSSSGVWAGLDLGTAKTITKARYVPRSGVASRMVGGRFQASTDGTNWVDLDTITQTPGSSWNELSFSNTNAYRYVRYLSPSSSYGNVAEIEFWGKGGSGQPVVYPDLTIGGGTRVTTNPATAGGTLGLVLSIFNRADVPSDASTLHIDLIRPNGTTEPTVISRLRSYLSIPAMMAKGEVEYTLNLNLPSSLSPGAYQLRVTIDPDKTDGQGPDNRGNDVGYVDFNVAAPPTAAADLVAQDLSVLNTSIIAGAAFDFSFGVRNVGTGASTATTTRVVLRNAAGNTVANLGSTYTVNALATGAAQSFNPTLTIPSGIAPGTYTLAVIVDAAGTGNQGTGATGNDTAVSTFTLTVLPTTTQPAKLVGTIIGTTGSYKNSGNTREKVFDGNTSTYFDGPTSAGVWVGLDLGSAKKITKARYVPRSGLASRMVGGKFQASTDGVNWIDLGTITNTPGAAWNEMSFTNTNAYRYVRYLGPTGSSGNVAELEFWGTA